MQAIGMSATDALDPRAHRLDDVVGWLDARVRDASGRRLGRVRAVVADRDGTPWWIVVGHHGREVVAPVSAVQDARQRVLRLDRAAEALAPSPGEIDDAAHRTLLARYGVAANPAYACAGRARLPERGRPRRRPAA